MLKHKIHGFLESVNAFKILLKQQYSSRSNKKIKVVFLAQYIPAWNKLEPIYEEMKKNVNFEVYLVCVPSGISNNRLLDPTDTSNDTYNYYVKHGYDALNALVGPEKWLNLRELAPDYVFHSRPYNYYMPKEYSSKEISKFSRICSILYGINWSMDLVDTCLNKDYYRYVYCYFAESKELELYNRHRFFLTHLLKLRKTEFFGNPAIVSILKHKKDDELAWDFTEEDQKRVIWTPRWTPDRKAGGSNFLTYKDKLIEYSRESRDIAFLFRPHPLTFNNFVKLGKMTDEEVIEYISDCEQLQNVKLDVNKEYVSTLWNSDFLISDISAILIEYFATGKPVIFCKTNMELSLTTEVKKIIESCYIVNSWQELEEQIGKLKRGEDILKEKRTQIIRDVFGDELQKLPEKVIASLSEK